MVVYTRNCSQVLVYHVKKNLQSVEFISVLNILPLTHVQHAFFTTVDFFPRMTQ